jgi:hypothetical protein
MQPAAAPLLHKGFCTPLTDEVNGLFNVVSRNTFLFVTERFIPNYYYNTSFGRSCQGGLPANSLRRRVPTLGQPLIQGQIMAYSCLAALIIA